MIAVLEKRKRNRKTPLKVDRDSNGMLMTPEEFDRADFDDKYVYELIHGVVIVSPIPSEAEADPNEELGHLLRNYQDSHPDSKSLDVTLGERYVRLIDSRRRGDRLIWAGLGRMPKVSDPPSIIVEFVSKCKRDRERDYETKRDEYEALDVQEYWIIDRFEKTMTVHLRVDGKFKKKVIRATQTYRTPLLPGFELPLARLLEVANRWQDEDAQ